MKKIIFVFLLIFMSCKTTNEIRYVNQYDCSLEYLDSKFEFKFELIEFHENFAYCATEGIPYALLIGKTDDPRLPKKISVFSQCNNNHYTVGEKMIIVPKENPTKSTSLKPIYFTKDTIVNSVKFRKIIGCENKIIWGNPK
ncbi:hypothetical protein HYN48_14250 [Flavobacterium magnum]|uniref:Lipoprotein n=1 Tax=Flavobacterium magnum TaxID=2162713 RepID=A0A2S0RJ53_9FLAO|nr:hypothetical protein [Flavobacterium magnum]AWA31161.1 hypothetical protein HYN48_14250 [Flavobacterium magnum]